LLTTTLPYLSRWPLHLSNSSMKELIQGEQNLETTLAQYFYVLRISSISNTVCERCALCAKNNPRQGPRVPPVPRVLVELLLKTQSWTSLKCHELEDANICWYLFVPSQDGWKPSSHELKRPGDGQVSVKGNHPLVWNTCVYCIR
jgi:hypothetical protein